jgi:hypothetical protein
LFFEQGSDLASRSPDVAGVFCPSEFLGTSNRSKAVQTSLRDVRDREWMDLVDRLFGKAFYLGFA